MGRRRRLCFRIIAQQGSKLVNAIWPGAGSAISSGVAAFGTRAIGKAAVAYFVDGTTLKEAKKTFESEKK